MKNNYKTGVAFLLLSDSKGSMSLVIYGREFAVQTWSNIWIYLIGSDE